LFAGCRWLFRHIVEVRPAFVVVKFLLVLACFAVARSVLRKPHRRLALPLVVLVMLGWLAPGLNQVAWAQTATVCNPAAAKGTDGPVDFGAYCWIDFTGLNLATARTGSGQPFQVNLRGGAYLTFNLKITPGNAAGNNMYAVAVPSWSGAAFGNSAFNSIPGNPILYQDEANQNAPQDTLTLSNLTLHANGSTELPFVFVAADGESSNADETLSFTTTGAAWSLVSAPGESNPGRNMPTLAPPTMVGNSTGSQTVNIAGTDAGADGEGSYVFTTDNSPGTVTATLLGNGLQGVLFGVKYHTIGLSLVKTAVGEFKAGGTGTYVINVANTVTYPEINPPDTPQPIRVVDTLPTGLTYASASGSGWSCSHVGQVITCDSTSLQDLTTSRTFQPITIGVNIAGNAPAELTNNAEVSDPTESTLVFNVCEVANNGVCPGSATSTTAAPTTILHSNLSDSAKSVLDKNGGDPEPGDVLEYTITLAENLGVDATGALVVDDMPDHVGSLTVISTPAGSTDSSTATGGANNTGKLQLSGITVPANGSVTIVYEVTIAGGTADGTTIDNTATITNPDPAGTGKTAQAPTIIVVQPGGGTSGKVLYAWNNNDITNNNESLTRTPPTSGSTLTIARNASNDWILNPVLAKDLVLAGGSTVSVTMLVQCNGGNCNNGTWTAALYDTTSATGTPVGTQITNAAGNLSFNYGSLTPVTLNLTVSGGDKTVVAGHRLRLRISNNSSQNRTMRVEQYSGGNHSTVTLADSTVINVDSVQPYGNANCTGSPVTAPYQAGSTVYVCAVVSDPFGSSDINTSPGGTIPSILISNAGGAALTSGNMAEVSSGAGGTKTFSYIYTVPATTSYGAWSAKVTAWEGTEHTVFDSGTGNFNVAAPPPDLSGSSKTVEDTDGGDAETGDVLRYTITLSESGGTIASNVSVTDDMPAHVGGLTVISKPAGSSDSSTTSKLYITGITVPANGSVTIVYEVSIAAGTTTGTTIDNSADIHNPDGADKTVSAQQVTVGGSPGVQNGDKYLYLRNETTITSQLRRSRPTNNGTTVPINGGTNQDDWELSPAIPNSETLALPTTISGSIVMATTGSNLTNSRSIRMSLWIGGTQLGNNVDHNVNSATPTAYAYSFTGIPSGTTLNPSQVLTLRIQNRGSTGRNIDVYQRNGTTWPTSYSYLTFNTTTVIKIDAAAAYSQPFPVGDGIKAAYIQDEHVYLRATVSDPFGTDDIDSVAVSIKNPTGTVIASGTMTPQADADTTDGSSTYEFVFTVPTSAPLGGWTATVTAKEGVEDLVQDVANIGFVVQGSVSLGKTWGVGANPGDAVNLTIGGATTSTAGMSTAGGSTLAATAAAAGGATLTLGEAFTSGSPGSYTITLACVRAMDSGTVTVSGTGLSRSIVMPSDSAVNCTWTNSKSVQLTVVKLSTVHSDPVNGTTNPKAIPGAVMEYRVIVTNPAANPVDADSMFVRDPLPAQVELRVADLGGADSGPVSFTNGSPASGMTYSFGALSNLTDDLQFSNDHGATWNYVPTPDANGFDPMVTGIRVNPKGVFNPNNAQFTLKFQVRIK
jgi:uncharacterized repeat protein (TIGR01451 family)